MKPEILFLQQEDLIKAGLLDMTMALEETEKTFELIGKGQVINPTKIKLGMPEEENWDTYCMSMPAYIGGDLDVAGFKWACESKANPEQGLPYGVDLVVLSNPHTVFPKAVMDGTITTAMRTSAAAGVCAKYTARKDSKVACLVGAGVIGRTMIMAIAEAVPGLETIYMVDLNEQKAKELAAEFEGKYNVVGTSDLKTSLENADVVVTETTAESTFIKKEWMKSNATVIQMEAKSFEEDVMLTADKIILDNWAQMSHLKGIMVHKLHSEGKLKEEDIIAIPQMVTGKFTGRDNDEQFIFCGTAGVGAVDIAIAEKLYQNAKKMGLGKSWNQWETPLWL